MFKRVFKCRWAIARHAKAPYAAKRAKYLSFCLERGDSRRTVQQKAFELLWISRKLKNASYRDLHLTKDEIRIVARDRKVRGDKHASPRRRRYCVNVACAWVRFLGYLKRPPVPFQRQLDAYCGWAREERGFSQTTITTVSAYARDFLRWFGPCGRPLSAVRINDIDAYLVHAAAQRGWSRISVRDVAYGLRAFFRFAATEGFAPRGLPTLIRGPRVYALEGLSRGPSWADVQRLLSSLDLRQPKDVRDRPILMLFALYGLRCCEVARLRLEDIDWERDLLHVSRAKGGGRRTYPLLASVGNAILSYLKTVRPTSQERALFLSFTRPHRQLQPVSFYDLVADRLTALGVKLPHRGPHCLRHACATHLLAQGESMKTIGDHLAHRSVRATGVYAKVDLPHLREVAAFDLGALS
jgi:site-specific recombinase XerD